MRTTLDIADDVLQAAKELARRQNKTAGEVISELARSGLTAPQPTAMKAKEPASHYGIRPFPRRGNALVTNELVNKLREGDAY